MPILNVTRRRLAKDDALAGLDLVDLCFDLIEMGSAVRSGVNSCDLHDLGLVNDPARKSNGLSCRLPERFLILGGV